MKKCPNNDCAWCYSDDDGHHGNGSCIGRKNCDIYWKLLDITGRHEYIVEMIKNKEQ
jgi:hypothetical protein